MSLVPGGQTASDVIPGLPAIPPVDYTSRDYQAILNDLLALIPTYMPEWVDRSPGDFGIVLMELFAYMGDILNYYSDRIANEAYLPTAQQRQSILNIATLLDYTPHNNVSATVQLQFTIPNPSSPVTIPAGTQVSTLMNGVQPIVFETQADLTIWGDGVTNTLPPATSNGLANQQFLITGPYDGIHESVTVGGVAWTQAPANSFTGQVATATMYIVVGGDIVQFGDGVHGAIPANGAAIVITYSPSAPNTYAGLTPASGPLMARHGSGTVGEQLGISTGLPNQRFTLFKTPVVDGSVAVQCNEGNGPFVWINYQRLVDAYSTDMAYTTSTDANGIVTIQFGDGVTGRIPTAGAIITADYVVGGGVVGNVSAGALTVLSSAVPGVLTVTNPQAASGGADAETTDHIRIHAPLSITAINRAVTLDDYAALVLNIPTVAKASAASNYSNAVNLYIHPAGDFVSDPATLASRVSTLIPAITNSNMTGYLDTKKMATVSVQVLPPQYNNKGTLQTGYVPVDITVNVQVLPQYHQQTVQDAVVAALSNLLQFQIVDFGFRVTVSGVYHTVQNVEGVDYANVMVLCRHEIVPTVVGDVVCAPNEIPQANLISVGVTGGISY